MTQRAHFGTGNVHVSHVEEVQLLQFAAMQFFDYSPGVRTLDLITIADAFNRFATRTGRRTVVVGDFDVVAAGFSVVTNPVGGRSAADEDQFILLQVEQDAVADHMAAVADRNVLLGAVNREVGKAVDGGVGDELDGVRPLDIDVHHVMALIEQYGAVAPCMLFAAPVVEFGSYDRIYVGADLGVAQQINRVACCI